VRMGSWNGGHEVIGIMVWKQERGGDVKKRERSMGPWSVGKITLGPIINQLKNKPQVKNRKSRKTEGGKKREGAGFWGWLRGDLENCWGGQRSEVPGNG